MAVDRLMPLPTRHLFFVFAVQGEGLCLDLLGRLFNFLGLWGRLGELDRAIRHGLQDQRRPSLVTQWDEFASISAIDQQLFPSISARDQFLAASISVIESQRM